MSVRFIGSVNFSESYIENDEEFRNAVNQPHKWYRVNTLLLKDGDISAEIYHDPKQGFFTTDEFLEGKATCYGQTWCLIDYKGWFNSLDKLSKASSRSIPSNEKVQIAILALI